MPKNRPRILRPGPRNPCPPRSKHRKLRMPIAWNLLRCCAGRTIKDRSARLSAFFASRLERKSVRPPQFKPGVLLCSFTPKRKFILFVQDMNRSRHFRGRGFQRRYRSGAEDTDPILRSRCRRVQQAFRLRSSTNNASRSFSRISPTLQYFPRTLATTAWATASTGHRLAHALEHVVIAHQEDGTYMFNFSEWLGTTSAVALGDLYHPGNRPGVGPARRAYWFRRAQDMGYDVLREFWPEIARKFKLPFRGPGRAAELGCIPRLWITGLRKLCLFFFLLVLLFFFAFFLAGFLPAVIQRFFGEERRRQARVVLAGIEEHLIDLHVVAARAGSERPSQCHQSDGNWNTDPFLWW